MARVRVARVTVERKRIGAVVLLREPDGAALLQHRDDKPGLPHANLWVPPGGHCDDDEDFRPCAEREFYEETEYRCRNLRFLLELDVDDIPHSPPLRLSVYWDIYDGRQAVVCREGQALEFVPRTRAEEIGVPGFLIDVWDQALNAWRTGQAATSTDVRH
jgi:8-oxo-dGTP pyrophosphatase MutT (NUDIX family)